MICYRSQNKFFLKDWPVKAPCLYLLKVYQQPSIVFELDRSHTVPYKAETFPKHKKKIINYEKRKIVDLRIKEDE